MTERRLRDVQVSQANFDDYVRPVAADGGSAGEIERAKAGPAVSGSGGTGTCNRRLSGPS
jgi:hypothetical protein